jgi:hypothetical protein
MQLYHFTWLPNIWRPDGILATGLKAHWLTANHNDWWMFADGADEAVRTAAARITVVIPSHDRRLKSQGRRSRAASPVWAAILSGEGSCS